MGPAGMGIAGLLNATLAMISALTNFRLSTSAVRNSAVTHGADHKEELARVHSLFGN